jgi:hypothetical protein
MADSSATGSAVNGKDILAPERMQLLQVWGQHMMMQVVWYW